MEPTSKNQARRWILLLLRIAAAAAGIGYICYVLQWHDYTDAAGVRQEGILTMLRTAHWGQLLGGLALTACIYPILTVRWWMLLKARNLPVTLEKCFRLTMVGNFFNFCMPGTTGGDLVKAYYAAKGSNRKADAVISVLLDRVMGLSGLFVVAAIAGVLQWNSPDQKGAAHAVTIFIAISGGSAILLCAAYFSGRVRELLRLHRWLHKLPGGKILVSIDAATVAYRNHVGIVLVSMGLATLLHFILALAAALGGFSMGIPVERLGLLLTVVPVLFLGAAVPISYQGLGIMEAIAKPLLVDSGACTMNQVVGMLLLIRLYQIVYSVFGALFLLRGDIQLHPAGIEEMEK